MIDANTPPNYNLHSNPSAILPPNQQIVNHNVKILFTPTGKITNRAAIQHQYAEFFQNSQKNFKKLLTLPL